MSLRSIQSSESERQRGTYDTTTVDFANRILAEDGVVVLEQIVDPAHVALIRERMLEDLDKFMNRPDAPFNWNKGNVQQDPPPFPPYLFKDILANDFVIQVTKSVLGAGLHNSFYSGNTAVPSESRQPVHADSGQLWPNLQSVPPPYALVVNVGLVDMSSENGSTEIWPGTHLDSSVVMQDGDIEVRSDVLEARRREVPPLQPTVKIGDVIIRDMRLWHAGMPNRTQAPRPMIAMIHYASWWNERPFKLHRSAETSLIHPDLRQNAEYFDGEIDYVTA